VGLETKSEHLPMELSGGEQQRACLARAIVKEPDILLADEPTGNLDPVASFELVRLLETINEMGTTILMASHNYNLIKGRGRRILEIKNGTLRGS
jgi:cell division transport system ATP-binding protein